MNSVTDRRREHLEALAVEESPSRANTATSRPSSSPPAAQDGRLREAVERLPVSGDYGAFLAQLHTAPSATSTSRAPSQLGAARTGLVSPTLRSGRDAAVQQRLDGFRDRFSGPYVVDGAPVTAKPMFRMNVPAAGNAVSAKAHAGELAQICTKAGIGSAVGPASVGRCTPEQLVKVTQALIDAGKLPAADEEHKTLENRIRGMQWEWGIGVDCAGYTQQAAANAHGAAGNVFKANLNGDIFSGMMHDRRFQSVLITAIRSGDVLHLDSPKPGEVGHNVICYSHSILDDAARAKLGTPPPPLTLDADAKAFLAGKGPFHAFEVDSSWGAGNGSMVGGFRRDTWVYDESAFSWAWFPSGKRHLPLQADPMTGPQSELFGGAFRPKEAP